MLARIKGMSRGSWIAIGLLAGVIAAPGVALAAFSDFRIVGVNGTPVAQVTPASQLRTAEADPASFRMLYVPAPSQNGCVPSQQIPGGSAFVLKQAQFDAYSVPAIGPGNSVALYEGPVCSGDPIAKVNPATVGSSVVPFDPGIAMQANQVFSVKVLGGVLAEVFLIGYKVTAAAVPANTPVLGPPGLPTRAAARQSAHRKQR
jgi:hypothetical protein